MSSLATSSSFRFATSTTERDSLEHDLVLALATADDLASGMDAVVGRIRRDSGAARVEWWATDEDGALELVAVDGIAHGDCHSLPLGPAGVFVLHGGRLGRQLESALTFSGADHPAACGRRAPGAHDDPACPAQRGARGLRGARRARAEDPAPCCARRRRPVEGRRGRARPRRRAARGRAAANQKKGRSSSVAECLDAGRRGSPRRDRDHDRRDHDVAAAAGPLGVILRNLLSNAVAAGARTFM